MSSVKIGGRKKRPAPREADAAGSARAPESQGSALDAYMHILTRYAPLSREDERALALEASRGDEEARGRLVLHNLRFAFNVARKFQGQGVALEDLIGAAHLGLLQAADRFQPERGLKFITYAVWWIRQAVQRVLAEQGGSVRIPANRAASVRRLRGIAHSMGQVTGRAPTVSELMDAAPSASVADAQAALSLSLPDMELDGLLPRQAEEAVQRGSEEEPEPHHRKEDASRHMMEILAELPEREAVVIRRYYGLAGSEEERLRKIASAVQLSPERVRQIRNQALERLRHMPQVARVAEDYYDFDVED